MWLPANSLTDVISVYHASNLILPPWASAKEMMEYHPFNVWCHCFIHNAWFYKPTTCLMSMALLSCIFALEQVLICFKISWYEPLKIIRTRKWWPKRISPFTKSTIFFSQLRYVCTGALSKSSIDSELDCCTGDLLLTWPLLIFFLSYLVDTHNAVLPR